MRMLNDARAVHHASHLRNVPFVTVGCPSLSKDRWRVIFSPTSMEPSPEPIKTTGEVKAAEGTRFFLMRLASFRWKCNSDCSDSPL